MNFRTQLHWRWVGPNRFALLLEIDMPIEELGPRELRMLGKNALALVAFER